MKGTVRQRKSKSGEKFATWSYQYAIVEGGRRRQVQRGGFRLKKDAEDALNIALAAIGKGDKRVTVQPSAQPVGAYLDEWLELRKPALRASTAASYETVIRAWIKPHVEHVPLRDLTGGHLSALYATLRARGGRGGRKLGDRSVQYAHKVLTMALGEAVEAGLLARSPIVDVPRKQRPTHRATKVTERVWTGEQAALFLTVTKADRLHPLWATALDTGARRGALAALAWTDVDLDAGAVTIRANRVVVGRQVIAGETKSAKPRKIDLDDDTVKILRSWKATQATERLAWGSAWTDTGLVFTRDDGVELHPEAISTAFEKAEASVKGLPVIRLHDLRHTSGTLALAAGVPPQVVQERLGHADIATTLRLYAHVLPTQQADAAARIGAAIYGRKVG